MPYKDYVILTAESSREDVELFLIHLFGYNQIDVTQSLEASCHDLFKEDGVVIQGGVAFFNNESQFILPSCCCGLEDWYEVLDAVKNRTSSWLGHDPSPEITYHDNLVRVWSDNPELLSNSDEASLYYIEFEYEELLDCLELTRSDLEKFIKGPLYYWMNSKNGDIADTMKVKMEQWFLK
ncbi:hypothetical protein [Paenibacillus sp. UMB4589-SE434]|uniref:hypothetical protein n=1 Tax=Paenibacillus sp. UMB4589-SE434 TaxID=3046314 RepID=UPI0025505F24|nr:hypothetical protein [Paenibacillus sp. UMB4589-SE434]MDK8183274.1 hypothetical protein [Paenibacillus sp. UMB4589-SE434]